MTGDVQRDMGAILAARLDQIQPDLAALQHPYRRAAEVTEQRDEYCRRVTVALALLDEMTCECFPLAALVCPKHELEDVLRGDK